MLKIKQADRASLLRGDFGQNSYMRKRSRIVAVQMQEPFTVETDRGVMSGVAGDWLVTNDPRDDPSSDLWTISADRMANTYEQYDG